jgi:F-type H+-transporting ATPase subunit gamma
MAKTQDIKRRIRSVRNTMQLTKAMKMVAASKMRRAQERILRARPYAVRVHAVLRSLAARADQESHPLLQLHGGPNFEVVVFTADKGLCGAFNSGVIRTAETFVREHHGRKLGFNCVGKKGRDYFARRGVPIVREDAEAFRHVEFATAKRIAADLMERYTSGQLDAIYLVYNEFKSAIQARPVVEQLLPIEREEIRGDDTAEEYIYEPSAEELLATLLPHYVENRVFHAMLESAAAEHAARMTAMDAASKNAAELIESLTLTMNRVRQASITTEIIEIVSGAQALG